MYKKGCIVSPIIQSSKVGELEKQNCQQPRWESKGVSLCEFDVKWSASHCVQTEGAAWALKCTYIEWRLDVAAGCKPRL